jgi:hypothetical protein
MRSGNKRKYFCFYSNRKNKHGRCDDRSPLFERMLNVSIGTWLISIAMTILFSAGPAHGQFFVQPMKLEPRSRANKMINTAIKLHSFDPNEVLNITLKVVELDQNPDGSWRIFDPDPNSVDYEAGYDVSRLSSCRAWITLEKETVELGPLAEIPLEVAIRIPPHVKGFYAAGIIVSMPTMSVNSDVDILLRYLIPVLVEIQGRILRPQIELQNVGVINVPPEGENPATTKLTVSVENKGPTFSRLKPFARIWAFQDGHWLLITRAEFNDVGIIPGVALNLETDINRALPTGRYRVAGAVYVDGRPGGAVEKEIDFVGDPSIQRAATDAPLDLAPKVVITSGYPSSKRVDILEVYNASDETVDIQTLFGNPAVLVNKMTEAIKGQDLTCPAWLTMDPPQFTLKSYESKRVRVIADIPASAIMYPWYYAVLGLYAHYPDGQYAGLTTTNICIGNEELLKNDVAKVALDTPKFRNFDAEGSQYFVTVNVQNSGLSHFSVKKCRAGLVILSGDMVGQLRTVADLRSEGSEVILPFEPRLFAGTLDVSSVPDALYRLEVNFEYTEANMLKVSPGNREVKSVKKQIGVQVITRGGRKDLIVSQSAEEILPNDIIQVNW